MEYCVYYDRKKEEIIEFFPAEIPLDIKTKISQAWSQPIQKKILITLSMHEKLTIPKLKEIIGHSMSTLHENIRKLMQNNIIDAQTIFKDNKKIILKPKILFVTKSSKSKAFFQKFFQGAWISTDKNETIVNFLKKNPDREWTVKEIAAKIDLPEDEVQIYLDNWESVLTRTLSTYSKEIPFQKRVLYKYRPTDSK